MTDNTHRLLTALVDAMGYEIIATQRYKNIPDGLSNKVGATIEVADGVDYELKKTPKDKREKKEVVYSMEFEVAWKVYPKKSGNKKIAAYQAWCARCDEIHRMADQSILRGLISLMIEGTKRYAVYHKALNTAEQYIHQGSTFFGREKLYMQDWDIPKQHKELKRPPDDKLNQFAIDNNLTHPAPVQCNTYAKYWAYLLKEMELK